MASESSAFPFPVGDGVVFSFTLPEAALTIGDIVGVKQRLLMEAIFEYNEAVNAARVLEPHIERVNLKVTIDDEVEADGPQQSADEVHDANPEGDVTCGACGQVH